MSQYSIYIIYFKFHYAASKRVSKTYYFTFRNLF